jgi:hypothetical protein
MSIYRILRELLTWATRNAEDCYSTEVNCSDPGVRAAIEFEYLKYLGMK